MLNNMLRDAHNDNGRADPRVTTELRKSIVWQCWKQVEHSVACWVDTAGWSLQPWPCAVNAQTGHMLVLHAAVSCDIRVLSCTVLQNS